MNAAALLHREVHRVAVRSPLWRALAIVDHRADFAALAAVRVHDPNVRVLHGGFAIGQTSAGAAIDNVFTVRRPQRLVLVGFRGGQPAPPALPDAPGGKNVIKKIVFIWVAVWNKQNIFYLRRP